MRFRVCALFILLIIILLVSGLPCFAWLYDGGIPQHLGAVMKDDTSLVWAAAPFKVESDSRATSFGAALARAYGPVGAGFRVLLTEVTQGLPGSTMAEWTIVPTNSALTYYYVSPPKPIFLRASLSYALVFMPDTDGFAGTISYSPQGYYGWGTPDYGTTWNRMAFPLCVRVDGSAVPEPASITSLILGLVGAGVLRRRSRS